jgi:Helix-turn-helix domain
MANKRLPMRKIKEVLRLKHHCRLSRRQIAHSLNISRSTAADYLERAKQAGIGWPLPEGLITARRKPFAITIGACAFRRSDPLAGQMARLRMCVFQQAGCGTSSRKFVSFIGAI